MAQLAWWLGRSAPGAAGACPYVYVHDDGRVRELTADEREYLATTFPPGDGGRPYIKSRYRERTAAGHLAGFLPRVFVPARVPVRPADEP